nr:hypothetical protein [Tanacetum cinerariifolium]
MFEHGLYKELKEVKAVFNQMETKVAKCSVDKKYFEIEKKEINLDNDHLLEHIIYQDVMNITMDADSLPVNVLPTNNKCLVHDNLKIKRLEKHIESLKGENVVEKVATSNNAKFIAPGMFKLDLEPLAPRVLNNRDSYIDYIKHSWEHADTLWEIVKHARALRPLDSDLDSACDWGIQVDDVDYRSFDLFWEHGENDVCERDWSRFGFGSEKVSGGRGRRVINLKSKTTEASSAIEASWKFLFLIIMYLLRKHFMRDLASHGYEVHNKINWNNKKHTISEVYGVFGMKDWRYDELVSRKVCELMKKRNEE